MKMREKIAQALWFDFVDQHGYPNGLPTWDELPESTPRRVDPQTREFMRSLADAVLDAMLDPDEEMQDAGRYELEQSPEASFNRKDAARFCFRAMIDAARITTAKEQESEGWTPASEE